MRYNLFLQTNAIFSFRQFSGGNIFSPVLTSPSSLWCCATVTGIVARPQKYTFWQGFLFIQKGPFIQKRVTVFGWARVIIFYAERVIVLDGQGVIIHSERVIALVGWVNNGSKQKGIIIAFWAGARRDRNRIWLARSWSVQSTTQNHCSQQKQRYKTLNQFFFTTCRSIACNLNGQPNNKAPVRQWWWWCCGVVVRWWWGQ